MISDQKGEVVIELKDIEWIEAEDYYAAIHHGGRKQLARQSLSFLEKLLDTRTFIRSHRTVIVNVNFVREVRQNSRGSLVMTLHRGTELPLARRRWSAVSELIRSRADLSVKANLRRNI